MTHTPTRTEMIIHNKAIGWILVFVIKLIVIAQKFKKICGVNM